MDELWLLYYTRGEGEEAFILTDDEGIYTEPEGQAPDGWEFEGSSEIDVLSGYPVDMLPLGKLMVRDN